jgi:hypothetical protein
MQSSGSSGAGFVQTAAGALTLRDEAFLGLAEDARPFVRGLTFVLLVGFIIALASLIGTVLTAWTSPDLDALFAAIREGITTMPWRQELTASELSQADETMDVVFDIVRSIVGFFSPSIPMALVGVVLQPIGMAIAWLIFGALAFAFAKLLGGTGTLEQTYGATSLAAAPYLLGIVHVLPYIESSGLAAWALICAYLGVKHSNDLSPGRAFWATLLPLIVLFALSVVVGFGVGAVLAATQFGLGGTGQ